MVVFPDASGPNISITRPQGRPPTPKAKSIKIEPVEITSIFWCKDLPNSIIEPLPQFFSIILNVVSRAFFLPSKAAFFCPVSIIAIFS